MVTSLGRNFVFLVGIFLTICILYLSIDFFYKGKKMACLAVKEVETDDVQLRRIESALNTAVNSIYEEVVVVGWFGRVSLHPMYEYSERDDFYLRAYGHTFKVNHLTAIVGLNEDESISLEKVGIWLNGSLIQYSIENSDNGSVSIVPDSVEVKCNMAEEVFDQV